MFYNYTLTMQPYYDYVNQCYRNILVLNNEPVGPLKSIVKRLNPPKLSEFNYLSYDNDCCYKQKCIYAICDVNNHNELMCVDDIPNLFAYLVNNDYKLDTSTTKMLQISPVKLTNPLICSISYKID
jgi:hypothetical protein